MTKSWKYVFVSGIRHICWSYCIGILGKKVKSLMQEFFNEKITLKVYSEKGESKIKIHCEICGIDYGTCDVSLVAWTTCNFKNHHMKIGTHQQCLSMPSGSEIPSCDKVQQITVIVDWFHIDQEIKLLYDFNKKQEHNLFKVVEATLTDYKDMKKVSGMYMLQ